MFSYVLVGLYVVVFFYRETVCVSAVFPIARCPSVRPSLRLSVTLVDCIQTTKDIVKLLSRPDSSIILVFDSQHRYLIPRGTPLAGAQNTRGWENFAIFDWNRRLCRTRRQANGCHGTLIGSHRRWIDSCRFWWPWMTLTRISRSLYTYKSNISKRCILGTKLL